MKIMPHRGLNCVTFFIITMFIFSCKSGGGGGSGGDGTSDSNSGTNGTNSSVSLSMVSATISNLSPTNSTNFTLIFGDISANYTSYCILENSSSINNCSFFSGNLPSIFSVSAVDGDKQLSIWVKDDAENISTRVDTNIVTLDTTPPNLLSTNITNASPSNTRSYSLSYGAITGSYASYCILENNTVLDNCTFVTGNLPSEYTTSATENAKILSCWLKDSAGNVSSRVDSNSVSYEKIPALPSVVVSNTNPTKNRTYSLDYGQITGSYNSYCIQENNINVNDCTFINGTLPNSYDVSSAENAKVLSVWLKTLLGTTSSRTNSNSVTLDTTPPQLASATINNASPTTSRTYSLTFGAISENYVSYCILENNTNVGSCSFVLGSLPSSFTVSVLENAKVLSVWIKDAAGNISTRVSTNSVTLKGTYNRQTLDTPSNPYSVYVADLNGDSYLDIISVGSNPTTQFSVFFNDGTGHFQTAVSYSTGAAPTDVIAKDLNGDAYPDILTADVNSNQITIRFNNGNGQFGAANTYATGLQPSQVFAKDINNDGHPDILSADRGSDQITLRLNLGNGVFGAPATYATGDGPTSLFVTELHDWGIVTLINTDYNANQIRLRNYNLANGFDVATTFSIGAAIWPERVYAADLNGDGKKDIVTSNSNGKLSVFMDNGASSFNAATIYTTPSSGPGLGLVLADLNGDNRPEIITNNSSDKIIIRFNNGNGTFGAPVSYATGASPRGIFVADLNNDGRPDIISADSGTFPYTLSLFIWGE